MKIIILLFSLLLFSNCSSTKENREKNNHEFYALAQRARTEMPKPDYRKWLDKMLTGKQAQLKGYEAYQSRETRDLHQHEVMTSGATDVGGQQDIHQFKALESGIQIKRWEQEKEVLEKQIFYLKSQLSALEE